MSRQMPRCSTSCRNARSRMYRSARPENDRDTSVDLAIRDLSDFFHTLLLV